MNFSDSLVVVASGVPVDSDAPPQLRQLMAQQIMRTHGTGILFQFKARNYLMTCRHVWDGIPQEEVPKAVVAGQPVIYMANAPVHYHTHDTAQVTTDAVFVEMGSGLPEPFTFLRYSVNDSPIVPEGAQLEVWGYPRLKMLTGRDFDPKLTCVNAVALNAIHFGGRPVNYDKTVRKKHVAQINVEDDLSGMSGGLVLMVQGDRKYPLGMLTGSGVGSVQGRSEKVQVIFYIAFRDALVV